MFRFFLRMFWLSGFVVLGLGVAQAQTLYGMEFNKPLKLPECKKKEPPYVPPKVCYVEQMQRVTKLGVVKDGFIFFPEGHSPQGASDNYLIVSLLNNKLVGMFYLTNGLSDQKAVFEMLKKRFGEPDMNEVLNKGDELIPNGTIVGAWFTESLEVHFVGGSSTGVGVVTVRTPEFAQLMGRRQKDDGKTPM